MGADTDLRALLDTGPFPAALRAAITARGLEADGVRARLRTRGVVLSSATLHRWQSGRGEPDRADSLAVLRHLEAVLEIPEGALAALLGHARKWTRGDDGVPVIGARPRPRQAPPRRTAPRWDARLTRLSQHDRAQVGGVGGGLLYQSRQVLRADDDGPDRFVLTLHTASSVPSVRPLRNCSLGRVLETGESGSVVAELLFDRPLRRGETVIAEYELVHAPPGPAEDVYERRFRDPVREFVFEVGFAPDRLPVFVEQFTRDERGIEDSRPVELDARHSVHGVALNFGPGYYGFRWGWH